MRITAKIPKKLKRAVSGSLAVVIAAAAMGPLSAISSANLSLDYIEEIKLNKRQDGSPFSIFEIAPNDLYSTVGYYAEGEENIDTQLKNYMNSGITTTDSRTQYVNNTLYASLINRGIMGASASADYPLYRRSNYREYMPWEQRPDNLPYLNLNDKEAIANVPGVFTAVDAEHIGQGEYDLNASYSIARQLFDFNEWKNQFYSDGSTTSGGHTLYKYDNDNTLFPNGSALTMLGDDYIEFGDDSVTVVSDGTGLTHDIYSAYSLTHGYKENSMSGGITYTVSFDLEVTQGKTATKLSKEPYTRNRIT